MSPSRLLEERARQSSRQGRSGTEIARRLDLPARTTRRYINGHNNGHIPKSIMADKMDPQRRSRAMGFPLHQASPGIFPQG